MSATTFHTDDHVYELAHPQKRVWYVEQTSGGTPLFTLGGTVLFSGTVDMNALQESIRRCVNEHDAFRLRMSAHEAKQYLAPPSDAVFPFFDFSSLPDGQAAFEQWARQELQTPFVLADGQLYDFKLFRLPGGREGFIIKVHHIVLDGWSISLVTDRIYTYYRLIKGLSDETPVDAPSYLDFVREEQDYLRSAAAASDRDYWMDQFRDLPDTARFNLDGPQPGGRKNYVLEEGMTVRLKEFLKENGSSPNLFYTALIALYLYKTTGQRDLVIGIPIANRRSKRDKHTVGMFTSTMPLRIRLNVQETFRQLLDRIRRQLRASYARQRYPYDRLVQDLELGRSGYNSLFGVCVNYYNTAHATRLGGVMVENIEYYSGTQYYPLQLVVKEWLDTPNLQLQFDYTTADYSDAKIDAIKKLLDHFTALVLQDEHREIGGMDLLDAQSFTSLVQEFNRPVLEGQFSDQTVFSLFSEGLPHYRRNTVIIDGAEKWTYEDFDRQADALAALLMDKGLVKGDRVALVSARDGYYVLAVWAVLRAGGVFVPIDLSVPPARRALILQETEPVLVLHNSAEAIDYGDLHVIDLRSVNLSDHTTATRIAPTVLPADPAYILYTSGSTGTPKGIVVSHGNLASYAGWAAQTYLRSPDDVFAFYSSISFDLTITSVIAPLLRGAAVRIFRDDEEGGIIQTLLQANEVTVIKLTPSHLSLIQKNSPRGEGLHTLIIGGEALPAGLARRVHDHFGGRVTLYNEYGPTEATVGCMIHRFDPQETSASSVPIGRPIEGSAIYILNSEGQPLPIGHEGELYIGGAGVTQGYYHRPELTERSFINNPFIPGTRLYRTGDEALFTDPYTIVFRGRKDQQVKLNGYRIELEEISNTALRILPVREAVTALLKNGAGLPVLVTFLVPSSGVMNEAEVRSRLAPHLPAYMMPALLIFLPSITVNANGKADLTRLQSLVEEEFRPGSAGAASPFEERVLDLIRGVLQVEEISTEDNYYFIGGDSIKAIQLSARLADAGLQLSVRDILSEPVIGRIISKVQLAQGVQEVAAPAPGVIPAPPIMHWFRNQQFERPAYYTQSVLLHLAIPVGQEALQEIVQTLVEHHDLLRARLDASGQLSYFNELPKDYLAQETDLSAQPDEAAALKDLAIGIRSTLDLQESLIRFCPVKLRSGQALFITAHHLVMDGVSMRILLEDLARLLRLREAGKALALPPRTASYRQWSQQILNDYSAPPQAGEVEALVQLYSTDLRPLLGHFRAAPLVAGGNMMIVESLGKEETHYLHHEANRVFHTTTAELLIIALAQCLHAETGLSALLLETEGHGRDLSFSAPVAVERTIGWFTQFYLKKIYIEEGLSDQQVRSIKEQLRAGAADESPRHGVLRDVMKAVRQPEGLIRFNYLGDFDAGGDTSLFSLSDEGTGPDVAPENRLDCLFELNLYVVHGRLSVQAIYSPDRVAHQPMNDFMTRYLSAISGLLRFLQDREETDFTPSDFSLADLSQSELDSLFS